jgi:CMP-N,N'-diacetyllegionaminic acid synthase
MTEARKPNVVAIILARGGSKGVPKKNIRELAGKPLLSYTVKAALDAKLVDRVIVSTDDEEIATVAKNCGAEVPFLRPADVSGDLATSEASLNHAIEWLEENEEYTVDILVYLQVTDPFRKKGMIDTCVQKLLDNPEIDSAFSAYPTHKKYWVKDPEDPTGEGFVRVIKKKNDHVPRQKDKLLLYREDTGIACATRTTHLREKGVRLGDKVWILEKRRSLSLH